MLAWLCRCSLRWQAIALKLLVLCLSAYLMFMVAVNVQQSPHFPQKLQNVIVSTRYNMSALSAANATYTLAMEMPPWSIYNNTAEVEAIQQRRQRILSEVCSRTKWPSLNLRSLHWSRMDDLFHTIYCGIPKCATTSWTAMQLALHGKPNAKLTEHFDLMKKNGIRFMNKVKPEEAKQKIGSYYKFLFVRHPLEKILAAWKNKLGEQDKMYYHNIIGKEVIRRFRKNATKESLARGHDTTFPEFVKYIIYVLGRNKPIDQHWQFMYSQCQPCQVKYDFIGKVETLAEDTIHVLRHAFNVTAPTEFPVTNSASITSSNSTTALYYAQVPPEDIAKLKEIYRLDMELFDYDPTIPGTHI